MTRPLASLALFILCAMAVTQGGSLATAAYQRPGLTERVSIGHEGEGNLASFKPSLSSNGRYVAFSSEASNLIPNDTNDKGDVFVRDRTLGTTERVSVASDGTEGEGKSWWPSISDDGRYVAFASDAPNLVPGDTNGVLDVFVHDRQTATTARASVSGGGAGPNGPSSYPWISGDGGTVAFVSEATNLVPEDTNGVEDVFVRDLDTEVTERASVATDGTEGNNFSIVPSISADGRFVAFESTASNLVPGDANGRGDAFVHDRQTKMTERVSVASGGAESNGISTHPAINASGRYVVFGSSGSNLIPNDDNAGDHASGMDVFVHDRESRETERISVGGDGHEPNHSSSMGVISADGRYVAFSSFAWDLVPDDTNGSEDVFVHDRETGETERVSLASDGTEANWHALWFAMSADGRHVAFESWATNLVSDKSNLCPSVFGPLPCRDVYVRDRGPATGVRGISLAPQGGGRIAVSGSATFSGVVIAGADDSPDDGATGARQTGGELVGASLTFRPQPEDVLVRLQLASMSNDAAGEASGGAGLPGVVYGLRLDVGGTPYEIRALQAGVTADPPGISPETLVNPVFALYRCDPDCEEISRLSGGMGTTGAEVRVSVPLDLMGASSGVVLDRVEAFTAVGEAASGPVHVFDQAGLPDGIIPAVQVALGVAPAGSEDHDVVFGTTTELDKGSFVGVVDIPQIQGRQEIWARACVGMTCGAAAAPVSVG